VVCHYETGCYCVRKTIVGSVILVYIGRTLNKLGNTAWPTIACLSQKTYYFLGKGVLNIECVLHFSL
jgi:hypothetical protein